MHIKTSGTAIIRHKDTGQVFEIEADEISDLWDSVEADEEPMGSRTTWEACKWQTYSPQNGQVNFPQLRH